MVDLLPTLLESALIDSALKGVVLLVIAVGLMSTLRRSSASMRHQLWSLTAVSLISLPILSALLPDWRVPGTERVANMLPTRAATVPAASEPTPAHAVEVSSAAPVRLSGTLVGEPRVVDPGDGERSPLSPERSSPPQAIYIEGVASTPSPPTPVGASGLGIMTWVLLIWTLGAGAVLLAVTLGIMQIWWLARRSHIERSSPVANMVEDLAAELEITRPVTLLRSDAAVMPMIWGLRPKVLLPFEADGWTDARLRAVLLHELAHVKRRDFQSQLIARVACALHWFNPLVWLAANQMRVERELACDDLVLDAGSKASDYAQHLLDIARSMRVGALGSLGSVALARRARLSDRLLAILDDSRRRARVTPSVTWSARLGAVAIVLPLAGVGTEPPTPNGEVSAEPLPVPTRQSTSSAVASVAPHQPEPPAPTERVVLAIPAAPVSLQTLCDWNQRSGQSSTSMHSDDGEMEIRMRVDDCRLDIEVRGEIVFSDDEADIVGVPARGYFEADERRGRDRRQLSIRPLNNGTLERIWLVDRAERPYDDEARQWLADLLPVLFRRTGFQAKERASRILAQQGVDGLMQEISLIPSDYVARRYYEVLLTQGNLDAAGIRRVVRQAGAEIQSDFELAELLIEVARNHPVDESVQLVYVEAAANLQSDFEHRRVLTAILNREGLSRQVADAMLQSAKQIDSDFELASLLIDLVNAHPIDQTLTPAYFDAAETIGSDFERRRVLSVVLTKGAPSQSVLDRALQSGSTISSDFELAALLIDVANLYPIDQAIPASYLTAAATIDSDFERARVLKTLVARGNLSQSAQISVLTSAADINSDHELAGALVLVISRYGLDAPLRPAFFQAVERLDSDYEHSRVLKRVVSDAELGDAIVKDVLSSSKGIGSDYEQASLLVALADRYPITEALRPSYLDAADAIGSSFERGRVLDALFPRGR